MDSAKSKNLSSLIQEDLNTDQLSSPGEDPPSPVR